MLKALLLVYILSVCPPDLSGVKETDIELHPTLGVVITLSSGTQVAFPVYPPVYVQQCDFLLKVDTFNLTYQYCYGKILYILGEPLLFKPIGEYDWQIMDFYPCNKPRKEEK